MSIQFKKKTKFNLKITCRNQSLFKELQKIKTVK